MNKPVHDALKSAQEYIDNLETSLDTLQILVGQKEAEIAFNVRRNLRQAIMKAGDSVHLITGRDMVIFMEAALKHFDGCYPDMKGKS